MPVPDSTKPHIIHVPPWPAPSKPTPKVDIVEKYVFVPAPQQVREQNSATIQAPPSLPQLPTVGEAATFLGIGFGFLVGTAIVMAAIGAFVLGFFLYSGCRMSRLFFGRIDEPTRIERIEAIKDGAIAAQLSRLELPRERSMP